MSEINNASRPGAVPTARIRPLYSAAANEPVGGAGPQYATDQLSLMGGAAAPSAEQYPQFVADTIAMLDSPDARQRYQAIINMTKMQPAEAIPLLERAVKNDNPQVVQLAQRALSVMQQAVAAPAAAAPATAATVTAPAAPATPSPVGSVTSPALTPSATAPTPTPTATPTPTPVVAPAPVAAIAPPAMPSLPAGAPRDFAIVLKDIKSGETEADRVRATLELANHVDKHRQDVINTYLNLLRTDYSLDVASPQQIAAAVLMLKKLNATEAGPFFQALAASPYGTQPEIQAALAQPSGTASAASAPSAQEQAVKLEMLRTKIESGNEAEKLQAMLQLEPLAATQRQSVVNILLQSLRVDNSMLVISPKERAVALSVLAKVKAPEAVPFVQALLASTQGSYTEVKNAAQGFLTATNGPAPAAAPAAAQPAPAQTAAVQGAPAAQPTAGSNLPSFLRR